MTYLKNQDDRLAYDRFRAREFDIGSGRVKRLLHRRRGKRSGDESERGQARERAHGMTSSGRSRYTIQELEPEPSGYAGRKLSTVSRAKAVR